MERSKLSRQAVSVVGARCLVQDFLSGSCLAAQHTLQVEMVVEMARRSSIERAGPR